MGKGVFVYEGLVKANFTLLSNLAPNTHGRFAPPPPQYY
jgi:hypothetical protein